MIAPRGAAERQIVPLDEVRARQGHRPDTRGRARAHDGRWIYEVEALSPDGVISTHVVDARTKAVLPDVEDRDDPRE